MKKKVGIFLILAVMVLICYCIGHSIYTNHIQQNCPLWDIYNKTCYACEHQDLVAVDNTISNRCSNRKIIEDCCHNGFYRSVPNNYVDKHHVLDCKYRRENVYDDCVVFDRR